MFSVDGLGELSLPGHIALTLEIELGAMCCSNQAGLAIRNYFNRKRLQHAAQAALGEKGFHKAGVQDLREDSWCNPAADEDAAGRHKAQCRVTCLGTQYGNENFQRTFTDSRLPRECVARD